MGRRTVRRRERRPCSGISSPPPLRHGEGRRGREPHTSFTLGPGKLEAVDTTALAEGTSRNEQLRRAIRALLLNPPTKAETLPPTCYIKGNGPADVDPALGQKDGLREFAEKLSRLATYRSSGDTDGAATVRGAPAHTPRLRYCGFDANRGMLTRMSSQPYE